MGRRAYAIETGKVGVSCDAAGFPAGSSWPDGVKGDGLLCSLKCIDAWIQKQAKKKK